MCVLGCAAQMVHLLAGCRKKRFSNLSFFPGRFKSGKSFAFSEIFSMFFS